MRKMYRLGIAGSLLGFLLVSKAAYADEGEVRLMATPVFVVTKGDHTRMGFGAVLRPSYDIGDILSVGGDIGCSHFSSTTDGNNRISRKTRCEVMPWVGMRIGAKVVWGAYAGMGYRLDIHSNQTQITDDAIAPESLGRGADHRFSASLAMSLEYRFLEPFALQLFQRVTMPMAGSDSIEVESSTGLSLGWVFY